ncbi:hypothetical protein FOFC_15607 [Fusarium oxysporum]|nr:hypothetical protein FOFC_15607 [Fusarium oxysporum]
MARLATSSISGLLGSENDISRSRRRAWANALTELGGETDRSVESTVGRRLRRAVGERSPTSSSMMASSKSRTTIAGGAGGSGSSCRAPYRLSKVPRRGRSTLVEPDWWR